ELAAVSPREMVPHTAGLSRPPPEAIPVSIPWRGRELLQRAVDPCSRQDTLSVVHTALEIPRAEGKHVARPDVHVVPAEVDPLRISHPWAQVDAEWRGEIASRIRIGAHARGARDDRRQQVRIAGTVDHRAPRSGLHGSTQGVAHPAPAVDPRAVVL